MRNARYVTTAIVLSGLSMVAGGCLVVAAGAGAGGAAYVMGDVEDVLSAPIEKVTEASVKALESLELTVISKTASGLEAKVIGRTSDDKKITISMKREAEKSTKISVRVGFRDTGRSQQILDEIKKRL
jgi:hypothetical protein